VAVVDVFDALISERPYKPAWEKHVALEYLQVQRGKQLDPECVDVFILLQSPAVCYRQACFVPL